MSFNIAIDGPSSAGKSTLAKGVARELGFIYVDTGAMYRAVGLYMLNNSIDINNEESVSLAVEDINIYIKYINGVQQIILNNENVTDKIRKEEVGHSASVTSGYKGVREKLLYLQRDLAKKQDVVMDGRDIGTNILPNAQIKIFLEANPHIRAIRRQKELLEKGIHKSVSEVEKDLEERDYRDSHRENNPLSQARDAILIDCTSMTIEEEIDKIVSIYQELKEEK